MLPFPVLNSDNLIPIIPQLALQVQLQFCDNVWAFVLNDCEFREMIEFIKVGNVKMVACNDKNTLPSPGSRTTE
uniref:Transcription initiation factor IIA gamma subunit C-terminal domain-containing protein n=1 Tax=Castor canadensis TaxID=51338 RepID=A0A8C0XRA7_CASCN